MKLRNNTFIRKMVSNATSAVVVLLATLTPEGANAQQPFSVTKLCEIKTAPDGFQEISNFFRALHPLYQPPYKVYRNTAENALLLSNMKEGCWLRIDPEFTGWSLRPEFPVYSMTEFETTKTRKLAYEIFERERSPCEISYDYEAFFRTHEYYSGFEKSALNY